MIGGNVAVKFIYFNDTGRTVFIHPATFISGCKSKESPIQSLEERTFILPDNTYPWVKMWDYGNEKGLQILVSPCED